MRTKITIELVPTWFFTYTSMHVDEHPHLRLKMYYLLKKNKYNNSSTYSNVPWTNRGIAWLWWDYYIGLLSDTYPIPQICLCHLNWYLVMTVKRTE